MPRLVLALTLLVVVAWPVPSARGAIDYPASDRALIVIDQDTQRMLIYDGDVLIKHFPISTGWPGVRQTTTPAWRGAINGYWGTFSSFGTTQDDGYWLFTDYLDDGSWNGDILIHGAPYQLGVDGAKQYDVANIGLAPVSHGCIQMLPSDMVWFRAWDPVGVAVEIRPFTDPTRVAPKLVVGAALTSGAPTAHR